MNRTFRHILSAGLLCGLLTVFTVPAAFCQDAKLGFINMRRIFEESPKFQQLDKELKDMHTSKQSKLEQQRNSLLDEYNQMKLKRDLLPETQLKQMQNELMSKQDAYAKVLRDEQVDFEKQKDSRLDPLIDQLKTIIETVAKEDGYSVIFKDIYLAYVDPKLDITGKVLQRFNATGAPAASAPAPSTSGSRTSSGASGTKSR